MPKSNPIVLFIARNVKDYKLNSDEIIKKTLIDKRLLCSKCLCPLSRHSRYTRKIKGTSEEITIAVVWCRACKVWHALIPDFLLPHKHYSADDIEYVIIESETHEPHETLSGIDTKASESTVRRWISQVGGRIRQAIGILKNLFGQEGKAVNEIKIDPGSCYSELEQILEQAPEEIDCCGNKLGMANIWLRKHTIPTFV
jgi:hypothetical protein